MTERQLKIFLNSNILLFILNGIAALSIIAMSFYYNTNTGMAQVKADVKKLEVEKVSREHHDECTKRLDQNIENVNEKLDLIIKMIDNEQRNN